MKTQFSKSARWWAAAAVGIALAGPVSQAAHAGAKAYTYFEITDFLFYDLGPDGLAAPTALETVNDVTFNAFLDVGRNDVIRFMGPGAGVDSGVAIDNDPTDGVLLDAPMACVGLCTKPENDFSMGDFDADEYNRADLNVAGVGLDLSADFGNPQGTNIDTGNLEFVAEAITQVGAVDLASSEVSNNSSFIITVAEDKVIQLLFDYNTELWMGLHPEAQVGSIVSGDINFDITVTDQVTGLNLAFLGDDPNEIDQGLSNSTPGSVITNAGAANKSGALDLTSAVALVAGREYSLNLTFNVSSILEAKKVPEPGPLALLGLGLLGFALRRKAASA